MCDKLRQAYFKYNISSLNYGVIGDKLGDVYESFILNIFNDVKYITNFNELNDKKLDDFIFRSLIEKIKINIKEIKKIDATNKIPKRKTGGNSKTDVLVKIHIKDGQVINVPISIKQTTVSKVALAEYDVDTILKETGIINFKIERLMRKFQKIGSAKTFTSEEKEILTTEFKKDNNKDKLLRWILTMSPDKNCNDIRVPKYFIKFQLNKNTLKVIDSHVYTIDEYILHISTNKKGNPSKGGFGTGLSWTYAAGSKGKKIQFKG